jgi:hypothetical protein
MEMHQSSVLQEVELLILNHVIMENYLKIPVIWKYFLLHVIKSMETLMMRTQSFNFMMFTMRTLS